MFKLELTPDEVMLIGRGLEELPYRMSAPLIGKINEQLAQQQQQLAADAATAVRE